LIIESTHGKNSFAEKSKNLAGYRSKNIFVIDHQNNYIEALNVDDKAAKNFNIPATSLSVLHNYLMVQTKFFQIYISAKMLCV